MQYKLAAVGYWYFVPANIPGVAAVAVAAAVTVTHSVVCCRTVHQM